MKTFNKKKGFTIVELVIVIAVIGVLTAILVPTFVNLTNKANDAADQSLVKNLNTQLRMKEQTEGKNATLTDALEDAKEGGYLVENLTPRGSRDIVWNQDKDEFSLLEGAPAENAYKFWKIYEKAEDVPSTQTYSIFAKGNKWTTVPTLAVGFDAGENVGIEVLNFETTAAVNAIIRTNGTGTVLNVNAANASVHHYDALDSLTITAIYGESYHEHGRVKGKAVISQGHIEIEEGASVPEVSVEGATGAVKVTANEGTVVTADAASADQTSIIANADDVYASGVSASSITGTKASQVELPTVVTSEETLEAAIAAKKGYIQLGADFDAEEEHVITGKTLFDFAGHTISSSLLKASFITNNSELTFVDTGVEGGIVSDNNNIVLNSGTLVVNDGKFSGNREYSKTEAEEEGIDLRGVIHNNAESQATINNIDLYTKTDFGVLNLGNMIINGGVFVSESEATGNRRNSYCVSSYAGFITINDAEVHGVHGGIGINGGKGIVNDATVIMDRAKNSFYALYIAGERGVVEATINGGTFNPGKGGKCLYVGNQSDGGLGKTAMSTVKGGMFNGDIYAAFSAESNYGLGILKVEGGQFKFNPTNYVDLDNFVVNLNDDIYTVTAK